jgi:16S rRNA (guanine(527)-N(7))-methyltransferase GidB
MKLIREYFPKITEKQDQQFTQLGDLYTDWNSKINVISRKDIENLYERHILHSLAIANFIKFRTGSKIVDLGTGGGFPGIPLAILFPNVNFTLIDGTRKKITVVNAIAETIGLENATGIQVRAEELKMRFDFVVTRAVARLDKLKPWTQRLVHQKDVHPVPNGLIALKGGRINAEIATLGKGTYVETYPLNDYFKEDFFEEKYLVYVQA